MTIGSKKLMNIVSYDAIHILHVCVHDHVQFRCRVYAYADVWSLDYTR